MNSLEDMASKGVYEIEYIREVSFTDFMKSRIMGMDSLLGMAKTFCMLPLHYLQFRFMQYERDTSIGYDLDI